MTNQNANPVPMQGRRFVMQTFDVATEVNTTVTPSGQPVVQNMPYAQQPVYPQQGFAQQPFYPQGYGPGQPFFGMPYYAQYPQGVIPQQGQPQFVPSYGPNGQVIGYVPVPTQAPVAPVTPPAAAPAAVATPPAAAAAPVPPVTPPVTPPQNWWQKHWKKVLGGVIAFLVLLFFVPWFIRAYSNFYNSTLANQQIQNSNNDANANLLATEQVYVPPAVVVPTQQVVDPNVGGGIVIPTQTVAVTLNPDQQNTQMLLSLGFPGSNWVIPAEAQGWSCPQRVAEGSLTYGPFTETVDDETRVWIGAGSKIADKMYTFSYAGCSNPAEVLPLQAFFNGADKNPKDGKVFRVIFGNEDLAIVRTFPD